jgi:glycosyltransferase involved in cell wall biosynthesis
MLEQEGVASGSIAVIPNGVESAVFSGRPRRASKPAAALKVITVANLRPEKSHETLIGAAALLAADFPDVQFQIVGDGPRRAALEARVRASGLERTVVFLGHREDVSQLLGAADVFVLPSRSEAFPNGAIEAMASGLPVVASAVGGLLDLIEPGRTGMLVPPGDTAALAAALRQLFTERALAARLGEAAREQVHQRYSFERMVTSFEELYLAGLGARQLSGAHRAQAAGI